MIRNRTVAVTVIVDMSTITTEGESLDKVIELIGKALTNRPAERDEGGPLFGTWRARIASAEVQTL